MTFSNRPCRQCGVLPVWIAGANFCNVCVELRKALPQPSRMDLSNIVPLNPLQKAICALFVNTPLRAREKNIPHSISEQFIVSTMRLTNCERTGLPFDLSPVQNGKRPFASSLDRRNNNGGYTEDNIDLVCNIYNFGKGAFDQADFVKMCVAVAWRQ